MLTAIWVAVMIALAVALMRRAPPRADPLAVDPAGERRTNFVVAGLAVATGVTVLVLTGFSFVSQRNLFRVEEEAVTIRITGNQWWWDVRYEDPDASRSFTTANELHIPTRPVGDEADVVLLARDQVLLAHEARDPERVDHVRRHELDLHRPGTYRGQCAEFCGLQHAHMGILVVAEDEAAFARWRDAQIRSADPPDNPDRQKGLQAFLSRPCIMCHSVRGTPAGGRVAPDLTHVGSRRYLAAGTLPMSRGNLAAWIVDPHGIKPGVNMPTMKLDPDDINFIAAYLEGLK